MDYKRILWTSLLVLAAGILLLCYKLPSLEFFVSCLGYLFLASAVLNIVLQFVRARRHSDEAGRKSSGASVFGMLSAVASGALGLWMVLSPGGFSTAMIYILGAMMILAGLFLVFTMVAGFRPVKFPFGFYLLPSLVALCGIVMCILPPDTTKEFIVMITAIAMIVFSVGALIEVAAIISFRRNLVVAASPVSQAPAEAAAETVTPPAAESDSVTPPAAEFDSVTPTE